MLGFLWAYCSKEAGAQVLDFFSRKEIHWAKPKLPELETNLSSKESIWYCMSNIRPEFIKCGLYSLSWWKDFKISNCQPENKGRKSKGQKVGIMVE